MLGDIENVTPRNSVNCGMAPRVFDHLFARIQKARLEDLLLSVCLILADMTCYCS